MPKHRSNRKDRLFARALQRQYPNAALAMIRRSTIYNHVLRQAKELEKKGLVKIIAPSSIGHLKTLSQDHKALEDLYEKGYQDAEAVLPFLSGEV